MKVKEQSLHSCGRLNSLHGSGSTVLIPGFDCDSFALARISLGQGTRGSDPAVLDHGRGRRMRVAIGVGSSF